MIQRIQTVYLIIGVILSILCLSMQIGTFASDNLIAAREYNLWCVNADGSMSFEQWPLFAVLLLSAALAVYAIFLYRKRLQQARLCIFSTLLVILWYILYFAYGYALIDHDTTVSFTPGLTAILPLLSMVLYILARRAIRADERLVRAADRIR